MLEWRPQRSLVCLLVYCVLLCGGALTMAASPRYLTVGLHELNAQVDCPPQASDSNSKLLIHPYSCKHTSVERGGSVSVRDRDRARLSTLHRPPFARSAEPAPAPEEQSVTILDRTGAYLDTLEFVVVCGGFGTPAQPSTIVFDTGSDLSWVQCLPCSGHCHQQTDPLFDPAKSSTYATVPCGQPLCSVADGCKTT